MGSDEVGRSRTKSDPLVPSKIGIQLVEISIRIKLIGPLVPEKLVYGAHRTMRRCECATERKAAKVLYQKWNEMCMTSGRPITSLWHSSVLSHPRASYQLQKDHSTIQPYFATTAYGCLMSPCHAANKSNKAPPLSASPCSKWSLCP